MAGMNVRQGREAFKANSDAGKVCDGKIHTQVELMDFRVSTETFDLSQLQR